MDITDCSMDFAFAFQSDVSNSCRGSTRKYSVLEWEEQKPIIERLYIKENRTTKDVVNILSGSRFVVT
jgi:hypothetical protein